MNTHIHKEMELEHFSHVHALNFERVQKDENDIVSCNGCREQILCDAYHCQQCNYLLHKRCAELPQRIVDPIHPQHLLTLFVDSPSGDGSYFCNVCSQSRDCFKYFCYPCDYNICMPCFIDKGTTTHASHEHPLTFLSRPALFYCNVCGTNARESSYLCRTCNFWIHKSCFLLPNTLKINDHHHHHPLTLIKEYLFNVTNFEQDCSICGGSISTDYWTYCCISCKYFAHVKCSTSLPSPMSGGEESRKNEGNDLMCLPISKNFVDLVNNFTGCTILEDTEREREINHWSHEHPLILFDVQNNNEVKDEKTLCSGCVLPISLPFYSCVRCNYFLHLGCSCLPEKLECSYHPIPHNDNELTFEALESGSGEPVPQHSVELGRFTDVYRLFTCGACNIDSNGIFYKCEICEFKIDVKCALRPTTFAHEAHKHPLIEVGRTYYSCNTCAKSSYGYCINCYDCDFELDHACSMLPHIVRHRWDSHPLTLSYRPLFDHPDEYHCEFCEDEINPKYWFYHCRDCDQSFHPACIRNKNPDIKYGGIQQVDDHPHPLTFVEKAKKKSSCCICGNSTQNDPLLECSECTYTVCLKCIP